MSFVNKLNNSGKIGCSLNWNSEKFIFNENTLLDNYPESLSKNILDGIKTHEKISGLPFRDILITKEQKKEIDDVMKKVRAQ